MLYSNIFGLVVDMNRVDVVLKTSTLQTHCSQIIFKTKTIENTFKNCKPHTLLPIILDEYPNLMFYKHFINTVSFIRCTL